MRRQINFNHAKSAHRNRDRLALPPLPPLTRCQAAADDAAQLPQPVGSRAYFAGSNGRPRTVVVTKRPKKRYENVPVPSVLGPGEDTSPHGHVRRAAAGAITSLNERPKKTANSHRGATDVNGRRGNYAYGCKRSSVAGAILREKKRPQRSSVGRSACKNRRL